MSFLRPAAARALRRWAEPAAAAALAGYAGWWGAAAAIRGDVLGWLALGVAALGLGWLRVAIIGALAARPVTGTGLVEIREGEIGYLGPLRGGYLELDALSRIEIYRVSEGAEPVWRLVAADGRALAIPAAAEGAGALPEALTALPGFSDLAAVGALTRGPVGRQVIWQRAGAARISPGAPPPAGEG